MSQEAKVENSTGNELEDRGNTCETIKYLYEKIRFWNYQGASEGLGFCFKTRVEDERIQEN